MADTSKSTRSSSTTRRQSSRIAKRLKATTPGSDRDPIDHRLPPLEHDGILQTIFSYVGDFQFRFIGGVNKMFQASYVALFPGKMTYCLASTVDNATFCWDDICRGKDKERKKKQKQILWRSAARYANIDVIKYFLEVLPTRRRKVPFKRRKKWGWPKESDWKYDLGSTAAQFGQKELLQWALIKNIPYLSKDDEMICHNAIAFGHIQLFQWALTQGFVFVDHEIAGYSACNNGQLDALKFLIDNKYDVYMEGDPEGHSGWHYSAASEGHVHILKWIHKNFEPRYDGDTLTLPITGGHIETVRYLLEEGCSLLGEENPWEFAAFCGPLAMLELLRSHDNDWETNAILVVEKAAEGGHLDIIKWAVENGCPTTKSACQYAAGFGHFDTLKGLRAMGCPWDADTTTYASTNEIHEWAKMNGCPVAEGEPRKKLPQSIYT